MQLQLQLQLRRYTTSHAMAATSKLESEFLDAASNGHVKKLKRLASEIGNGGEKKTKGYKMITDAEGRNALHLAAESGIRHMCKVLIEQLKFDVDSRDNEGNTPLIVAIMKHHNSTAEYLIESGAGIGCRDHWGFTALHHAAQDGQTRMLRLLLSKGAKVLPDHYSKAGTPLHVACSHGRKESVKILLDAGAHPDSPTEICVSPLMLSIMAKSIDCMELLFKAGADANYSSYGETPLTVAAIEGDTEIIKYLLNAGAKPDLPDIFGVKPIEHAALHGNVDAVKALFHPTSRISSYPDWSVDGIMKYVQSEEAKTQREIKRKEDFQIFKDKGQEAFKKKDYEMAKFWYIQASLADPTDATVLSNRSLCWAKLNEGIHAYIDAEACVKLKPDWEKAHYRMGAALVLLNEHFKASVAFSMALKLAPNNKEIQQAHRAAVEAGWAEFIANKSRLPE